MARMFYTLEEAAKVLQKTEAEILKLAEEQVLRDFRDGPRHMFKVEQVNRLKMPSNPTVADWTVDPTTGRSNSSPEFLRLVAEITNLINGEAANLMTGKAEDTAILILAQLAHKHGLAPQK